MKKQSRDAVRWVGRLAVAKYDEDQTRSAMERYSIDRPTEQHFKSLGMAPREVILSRPNIVTTNGLTRVANLIIGESVQAATDTASRIGVGDDNTAESAAQTDLQAAAGSTHRYFEVMDSTYPSVASAVFTFKATFGSSDGNFHWQEACVDIGTPTVSAGTTVNALMLNRVVSDSGTKSSGTSWVATMDITLSSS